MLAFTIFYCTGAVILTEAVVMAERHNPGWLMKGFHGWKRHAAPFVTTAILAGGWWLVLMLVVLKRGRK